MFRWQYIVTSAIDVQGELFSIQMRVNVPDIIDVRPCYGFLPVSNGKNECVINLKCI